MSILNTGYTCDGEVLSRFLNSQAFVRGIRGPIGSGTSSACVVDLFANASQQTVQADGLRYSRSVVVRQTNPMLETTTIKTWLDWFPESEFGKFKWSPPFTHRIRYEDIVWEVIFMPCNTEDDVSRLLSLEISSFWVNEARDVPKEVVDGLTGRLGRYPAVKDGGCKRKYGVMDTNAMAPDHWWPIMAGEQPPPEWMTQEDVLTLVRPPNWEFFCQPPAMLEIREEGTEQLIGYRPNPKAENVVNLTEGYYDNLLPGKRRDWIKLYIFNELGMELSGKAIYDQFNEETHSPEEPIEPYPDLPIVVGIDFGLTPAAVICQKPFGRWRVLSEVVTQHMGAARLATRLHEHLSDKYPDWYARRESLIKFWGDPAGNAEAQTDETTPFQVLKRNGIPAKPAPTNDFELRIGAVNGVLMEMSDGLPRFQIDRVNCPVTFAAMKGGYQRRRLKTREERYAGEAEKNRYSHPAEALQYAMVGEGEAKHLVRDPDHAPKPGVAGRGDSIIARRRDRKLGKKPRAFKRRMRGPMQP